MYRIVVTGFNCSKYAKECINSCLNQRTTELFTVTVVDDGSTDDTFKVLTNNFANNTRVTLIKNAVNKGAAYSRHSVIYGGMYEPEDVILLIGLDDKVKSNLISTVSYAYNHGAEVTYGTWENEKGKKYEIQHYTNEVLSNRDFRKHTFISTAPNTFKCKLYKRIPVNYLQIKGCFVENATDVAVMWSVMELAKLGSIRAINTVTYIYFMHRDISTLNRFGWDNKKSIVAYLRKLPKL